jgi:anti-anti-sigma factor
MEYTVHKSSDQLYIQMNGSFTFDDNGGFREIIETMLETPAIPLILDLYHIDFVDSAALGMLLILREEAQKTGTAITLMKPAGQPKKMIELSQFHKLFTITE